jgi:hypothetical protein
LSVVNITGTMTPENTVGSMERALGHPLMTLNDLYEATWDDKYLKGAARLVDWAVKWEHPARSGFLASITEWPAYYSGSPFCGGLLPTALIQFNQWAKSPELDEMLERVARWTLTDVWRPPAYIQQKGGSPRANAWAQNIASHLPLMSHVFARTGDPLFLAVPREAVVQAFRENAPQIGTRSAGIVFKYLPSFLATLAEQGHPQPEPDVVVRAKASPVLAVRGGITRVCFTLGNGGAMAARRVRASFQPRVDLLVAQAPPVPDALEAGREVELCYDVKIPRQLNLTSEASRVAYAHLSVIYERETKPHVTHTWIQLRVEEK